MQLWTWKHATTGVHDIMPLTNFGYDSSEDGSTVHPTLMRQPAAAPELLNDLTCECSK